MGFMDRVHASWNLVKLSWNLLMQDKELLLFPVISTLAAIALFIGIVVPSLFGGQNLPVVAFILWYFAAAFVTIFMNAALFACVKKRMHGGDPTIGYGFKEASKRIVPILLWSLITASVGLILRMLENRAEDEGGIAGLAARIAISIVGAAWTLITMFVVPVIVVEGVGPFAAIRRSASLFKKTWGENVVAGISMGLAFFVLYIIGLLVALVTLLTMPAAIFLGMLVIVVLYMTVVAVFQSTLGMVFDSVLYAYAAGDNVPLQFKSQLERVFVKKK